MKEKTNPSRLHQGSKAGWVGMIVNLLLFLFKCVAGWMSRSVSIMADAMNSLFDGASSLLTLLGFKWAAKPADRDHPYGHQRAEYVVGLLVAVLILFVGFQFLLESIKKIIDPQSVQINGWVLAIMLVSILSKIGLGYYYQVMGRSMDSNTILAASKDSWNDVLMTLSIIISLLIEHWTAWQLDGYVGLVVALFILVSGLQAISQSASDLLGEKPPAKNIKAMVDIIESYDEVLDYHDLDVHSYGPDTQFATVHIEVDARMALTEAHYLVNAIETDFKQELHITLVSHVDPIDLVDDQRQALYQQVKTLLQSYDPPLSLHDFRLIKLGDQLDKILFDVVVPEAVTLDDEDLYDKIKKDIDRFAPGVDLGIDFDRHDILHQAKEDYKEEKE